MAERVVAVVGVGLIGGSIAAAVKQQWPGTKVIGVGRHPERLQAAQAAGLVDRVSTSIEQAALESSLLVVCTPVDSIANLASRALNAGNADLLVTDGGSVKRAICEALPELPGPGGCFVGSHPLAGSEKQGFEYARADLFINRVCVVTPTDATPRDWTDRLGKFWRGLGARVLEMSASDHDLALAETSHMPHVVAAALARELQPENYDFAATGFRDTTRIAAGDPNLWSAILLANSSAMVKSLAGLASAIAEYREAIEQQDEARLKMLLQEGKRNREAIDINE